MDSTCRLRSSHQHSFKPELLFIQAPLADGGRHLPSSTGRPISVFGEDQTQAARCTPLPSPVILDPSFVGLRSLTDELRANKTPARAAAMELSHRFHPARLGGDKSDGVTSETVKDPAAASSSHQTAVSLIQSACPLHPPPPPPPLCGGALNTSSRRCWMWMSCFFSFFLFTCSQ